MIAQEITEGILPVVFEESITFLDEVSNENAQRHRQLSFVTVGDDP
jgi:hypothetical protein